MSVDNVPESEQVYGERVSEWVGWRGWARSRPKDSTNQQNIVSSLFPLSAQPNGIFVYLFCLIVISLSDGFLSLVVVYDENDIHVVYGEERLIKTRCDYHTRLRDRLREAELMWLSFCADRCNETAQNNNRTTQKNSAIPKACHHFAYWHFQCALASIDCYRKPAFMINLPTNQCRL